MFDIVRNTKKLKVCLIIKLTQVSVFCFFGSMCVYIFIYMRALGGERENPWGIREIIRFMFVFD